MILETAAIIGMYLWLTEDDGLLRKPFAWCASRVKNKYLNKALFDKGIVASEIGVQKSDLEANFLEIIK